MSLAASNRLKAVLRTARSTEFIRNAMPDDDQRPFIRQMKTKFNGLQVAQKIIPAIAIVEYGIIPPKINQPITALMLQIPVKAGIRPVAPPTYQSMLDRVVMDVVDAREIVSVASHVPI